MADEESTSNYRALTARSFEQMAMIRDHDNLAQPERSSAYDTSMYALVNERYLRSVLWGKNIQQEFLTQSEFFSCFF